MSPPAAFFFPPGPRMSEHHCPSPAVRRRARASYCSAAGIVVLPFQRMLTSGSLLLAMTFDKPVIAPRLAVIAEALGPAGDLLYDPQDERGLAGAIELGARTDLRSLAGRTRRQCDQLAWRAIAQQASSVYGGTD